MALIYIFMKYNTVAEYSEKIIKLILIICPFLKSITQRFKQIFFKNNQIFDVTFLQQFEPILFKEKIIFFQNSSTIIEKFQKEIYLLIFQEIFEKGLFQFLEISKSFLILIDDNDETLFEKKLNFIELLGKTTDTMINREKCLKLFPSKEEVEKILNFDIMDIQNGFGIKNILIIYFLFCYLENIYTLKPQKLNDFNMNNCFYDINFIFSLQIQYNVHLFFKKNSGKQKINKYAEKLIEKLRNLFLRFFPSMINPSFELTVSVKSLQKKIGKIIIFLREEGYTSFNISELNQSLISK